MDWTRNFLGMTDRKNVLKFEVLPRAPKNHLQRTDVQPTCGSARDVVVRDLTCSGRIFSTANIEGGAPHFKN